MVTDKDKDVQTTKATTHLCPLMSLERYTKFVLTPCLADVLPRINAKFGGLNSLLFVEHSKSIPHVPHIPNMILGMNVFHGFPDQFDLLSIAVIVNSRIRLLTPPNKNKDDTIGEEE